MYIENKFATGLLYIQLFIYAFGFFIEVSALVYLNAIFGLIGLMLVLKSNSIIKRKMIALAIASSILLLINFIFRQNYPILSIAREVLSFFATASLLVTFKIDKKSALIIYYIACIYMLYRIGSGLDYENLFVGYSRNYVSLFLFVFLLPYYVACTQHDEVPSLIPMLICLALCVGSLGRGNIISAAFLVAVSLIKNIITTKGGGKWITIISILTISVIIYVLQETTVMDDYLYRFTGDKNDEGLRTDREIIWSSYYLYLLVNPVSILIGGAKASLPILNYYLHLHNSFLMVHLYTGIIGFLGFIILCIRGLIKMVRLKYFDLSILSGAFLLKSFTDWCFPLQIGSIIMWCILFYSFVPYNPKSIIEK